MHTILCEWLSLGAQKTGLRSMYGFCLIFIDLSACSKQTNKQYSGTIHKHSHWNQSVSYLRNKQERLNNNNCINKNIRYNVNISI